MTDDYLDELSEQITPFVDDDELEIELGKGETVDEAYEHALERSPDGIDDDIIDGRHQYGEITVENENDENEDVVLVGVAYNPSDIQTDKKSGSGAIHDEPGSTYLKDTRISADPTGTTTR